MDCELFAQIILKGDLENDNKKKVVINNNINNYTQVNEKSGLSRLTSTLYPLSAH